MANKAFDQTNMQIENASGQKLQRIYIIKTQITKFTFPELRINKKIDFSEFSFFHFKLFLLDANSEEKRKKNIFFILYFLLIHKTRIKNYIILVTLHKSFYLSVHQRQLDLCGRLEMTFTFLDFKQRYLFTSYINNYIYQHLNTPP